MACPTAPGGVVPTIEVAVWLVIVIGTPWNVTVVPSRLVPTMTYSWPPATLPVANGVFVMTGVGLSKRCTAVVPTLFTDNGVSQPSPAGIWNTRLFAVCDTIGVAAPLMRSSAPMRKLVPDTVTDYPANAVGGMFGLFFRDTPPRSFAEVMTADKERFNRFFHLMLDRGIYLAPSAFEAGFVSAAHGEEELKLTLDAAGAAFDALAR